MSDEPIPTEAITSSTANKDVDQTVQSNKRAPDVSEVNQFSKRQLKRMKKREKFDMTKQERRQKERERLKAKRKEAIENGLPGLGPSRKELKRRNAQPRDTTNSQRIVIDLDFDTQMTEREISKCLKQCLRIYTINRRSHNPCLLHMTGIKSNGSIHECLKKNDGWENWMVKFYFDQTHADVFEKDEIIYLTSESDNVLEELDTSKVYVIGGLVDHNHHKGLCHERAVKADIKTARLPLNKYIDMKSRSVLTTYHVFEILLRLTEGKSWTDTLLETLPMRKGAKPKTKNNNGINKNNLKKTSDYKTNEEVLDKNSVKNSGETTTETEKLTESSNGE